MLLIRFHFHLALLCTLSLVSVCVGGGAGVLLLPPQNIVPTHAFSVNFRLILRELIINKGPEIITF